MLRKILRAIGILLALLIVGGGVFVASRQNLRFESAAYPDISASTDSTIIERGRYIVRNVADCTGCHGDPTRRAEFVKGEEIPLIGGFEFAIPPGQFYTRNLTSDSATGLGSVSDKAIARALRQGVGHDGRVLLPFMEMQGLSDDDLQAVVSYIKTQPPVHNEVKPHYYNILGKIIKATAFANPVGPSETPLTRAPRGASVETGKYLVEKVALCWACHTERSQMTGALTGPRFGGTKDFTEVDDPTHSWAPPNITSDPETGRLGRMTEDQFVARFRQGRVIPASPMPWQVFSRMSEEDLRAIYMYLKTVPAVKRDNGPVVIDVKKN